MRYRNSIELQPDDQIVVGINGDLGRFVGAVETEEELWITIVVPAHTVFRVERR